MSFNCTPSELVSFVLEKLSFSGQNGLTLSEMWESIRTKLDSNKIDSFQEQIIWQWLFFSEEEGNMVKLYVILNKTPLPILPNYKDFVSKYNEDYHKGNIRILPTADTQWRMLTGLESTKKARAQLGDKPFELLCEIARSGPQGITSPDLCRATNQDPRSMPPRFKKLEESGFIIRNYVYDPKIRQHTSLCIHSSFAKGTKKAKETTSEEQTYRNAFKARQYIVQSVKNAPNNLRSFQDLKQELNLHKNKSSSKFFRAIVQSLHNNKYVERVMVKSPEDGRSIYAIKYIKDLPKDPYDLEDYVENFNANTNEDEDDRGELATEFINSDKPLYNLFFPNANQIHNLAFKTGANGIISTDLMRNISGVAGYRPLARLLDNITSYTFDGKTFNPLKKYPDEYNEQSLVKTLDSDAKYKFYRYFGKPYVQGIEKAHTGKPPKKQPILNKTLAQLNTKEYIALEKVSRGDFLSMKKRSLEETPEAPKKKKKKEITEDAEPEYIESKQNEAEEADDELEVIEVKDIKPITIDIESVSHKKIQLGERVHKGTTIRSSKRRSTLLDIIKQLGGVTYTTASLRRMVNDALGDSSSTLDVKTLARDISVLIAGGELDVEEVKFVRTGQSITRKILILTNEKYRPTPAQIEEAKNKCILDNGDNEKTKSHRVVEGEVTFYNMERPTSRRRGSRLQSLGDKDTPVKRSRKKEKIIEEEEEEIEDVKNATPEVVSDTIPNLVSKKHRGKSRPAKKTKGKKGGSSRSGRRVKVAKFDKSDATTLFRSIVISKTLKRGTINFAEIADLFEDMDARSVKQKWTVVRRSVGGLAAVTKGTEDFERVVMKGIDDELVSAEDLENVKFQFFLDLWKDADGSTIEIADKTPLYVSVEENLNSYNKIETGEAQQDLYELLEDNSMRQKELTLSGVTFFENPIQDIKPKENDHIRTVLKAIFSTTEENFSSSRATQILSEFGEDVTFQASTALIRDREMSYFKSDDSSHRFVLTDKVTNSLTVKTTSKFFKQAANFKSNIESISEASKGLILSQGISNGQMSSLLALLSDKEVSLAHIDKAYKFEGYESRLIDKDKLACDIVVFKDSSNITAPDIVKVPVPTGKACSHVWLDLNGNINEQLWIKIIIAILYYIHFRPGITSYAIHNKLSSVLGCEDFKAVVNWLVDSHCIGRGDHDSYWVNSSWYGILGL
ncbi:RNA polymerase III transcription factor [Scheffersomyces coipomensis]|uniref:RNA polymerase III transcription factor n=1 Tax=Scheffersomyces coipomensis TaxID=1788519 RepID=UPI00315DE95F